MFLLVFALSQVKANYEVGNLNLYADIFAENEIPFFSVYSSLEQVKLLEKIMNLEILSNTRRRIPTISELETNKTVFRTTSAVYVRNYCFDDNGEFQVLFSSVRRFCNETSGVEEINELVKNRSQELVQDFLPKDSDVDSITFVHSIFFSSAWNKEFQVQKRKFGSREINFLRQVVKTRYVENELFSAVELPLYYGFSVRLVRPKISKYVFVNLDAVEWSFGNVEVVFPKFELEFGFLADVLKKDKNLDKLFDCDSYSKFHSRLQQPCKEIKLFQKNYIRVDEEGINFEKNLDPENLMKKNETLMKKNETLMKKK